MDRNGIDPTFSLNLDDSNEAVISRIDLTHMTNFSLSAWLIRIEHHDDVANGEILLGGFPFLSRN
jgi:hypothetical protein